MELEQAKEVVASMATREPAVYTKREQTSSWNRIYELAGETNYTRNGITISNTESAKLEYWDGESIDLSGLVVKYTGDNAYTEAVEKAELDDVCENWQSETSTARIESDDNVVDNRVTKMITVSAIENPSWTAEVEITVKRDIVASIDVVAYETHTNNERYNQIYDDDTIEVFQNSKDFYHLFNGNSIEPIKLKYTLTTVSGKTSEEKEVTKDMISIDTSKIANNVAATFTYTDPDSNVSVSTTRGNIDVEEDTRVYVKVSVREEVTPTVQRRFTSIEVNENHPLPDGITYVGGELLYGADPLYVADGIPYNYDWIEDNDCMAIPGTSVLYLNDYRLYTRGTSYIGDYTYPSLENTKYIIWEDNGTTV